MSKVNRRIDWFNTGFITFFTVAAIVFTTLHFVYEAWNWWLVVWFMIFYFVTGLGITAGYHRMISHRAYKANSFVKLLYLICGAGALENSALKWCADHRRHHTHCDHDEDPYNINEGFMHAHIGWILQTDAYPTLSEKYAADMRKDPLIMWQYKYYLPIAVSFGIFLPAAIGFAMGVPFAGLGILAFGRIVLVHHFTYFINSLCHTIGTQPFTDTNTAKDSWISALFSYGEGYHNFHHYFQADYRNGIRWYDFDPTKWLIAFFAKLGWAWDLKVTPEEDIIKAKLEMERKRLGELTDAEATSVFGKLESGLARWSELRKEYIRQKKLQHSEAISELSDRLKETRLEVMNLWKDWHLATRGLALPA